MWLAIKYVQTSGGKFAQSEEKGRHALFSAAKQLTARNRQEREKSENLSCPGPIKNHRGETDSETGSRAVVECLSLSVADNVVWEQCGGQAADIIHLPVTGPRTAGKAADSSPALTMVAAS
ncbi:unnamed protein product [Gadus morhua 'NCC']